MDPQHKGQELRWQVGKVDSIISFSEKTSRLTKPANHKEYYRVNAGFEFLLVELD